jgi:hypothetical protein
MDKLTSGTLTPAYGRDYKNGKEAEADFRAGKDFVLNTYTGSGICGIADFQPGCTVTLRYKRLTQIKVIKV